jgi:toxin ParE1/3/4
MPGFRLTKLAKADLKDIGRYTQGVWGREQRNRYLANLDASFHDLAQTPHKGRSCDDIRQGYRKYQVGRHVIFYRQDAADIEIVRILHDRMDAEAHLSTDF